VRRSRGIAAAVASLLLAASALASIPSEPTPPRTSDVDALQALAALELEHAVADGTPVFRARVPYPSAAPSPQSEKLASGESASSPLPFIRSERSTSC
jgi:hypothetical protein